MIYDCIDIVSKVGIVHMSKKWLSVEVDGVANVDVLKSICQQYNVFDMPIPDRPEDADLYRLLLMIGIGVLSPLLIKTGSGSQTQIGMRLGYEIPEWVFNQSSWRLLCLHAEQMLDAHAEAEALPIRKLVLDGAMDRFRVEHYVRTPPREPNMSMEYELGLIESLRGHEGELKRQWRNAVQQITSRHLKK